MNKEIKGEYIKNIIGKVESVRNLIRPVFYSVIYNSINLAISNGDGVAIFAFLNAIRPTSLFINSDMNTISIIKAGLYNSVNRDVYNQQLENYITFISQ